MKKFLLLLFAFLVTTTGDLFAQTYKYHTTDYAFKAVNEYGQWLDWSDWEPYRCLVTINIDKDVITVYSDNYIAEYDIVDNLGDSYDESSSMTTFLAVDNDGDRCYVKLRSMNTGVLQLYVEYSAAIWVYNLTER